MADTFVTYAGDGIVNSWTVPFPYLKKTHVQLFIDGVEDTTFTWLTDSSIAATSTPADGAVVLVKRNTPRNALDTTIPSSGTFRGADLNNQSLQSLYVAEEAYDSLTSVLSLDTTDNKYDADTKVIKNVVDPSNAQDAATKNYVDTKFAADVAAVDADKTAAAASASAASSSASAAASSASAASASATAAAASESAAGTSETNAAASASAASTSATNASNSASAASTSETNAGTSETNAAASASAASTSETNAASSASAASTSATNAATSATNASNAQTAAETAQTAAETALDSFDDRYLGAKSSDPTLDNDGDALIDGALYFNTTSNEMRVYDLGTTSWLAAYASAVNASDITNDSDVDGAKVSDAINNLQNSRIGTVTAWPVESTLPYGALALEGQDLSTTTYADLYAAWGSTAKFGSSGAGQFYLPDWRGYAIRGHDNGAAVDPDAASRTDRGDGTTGDVEGTLQADEFKLHNHVLEKRTSASLGSANGAPAASNTTWNATAAGNIRDTGGNETRMVNAAARWITYWK